MKTEKIILFPPSYEERLKTAKEKMESAELAYKTLRGQCKHERKIWKDKCHAYYCEVCEKFLPRR